ncbi:MAG: hypothetical protein GF387_02450 [Candidatus Portnoybacteria bacterium]|nr:hypothetical protein [Candidatus Portnoybacteria bacterium]
MAKKDKHGILLKPGQIVKFKNPKKRRKIDGKEAFLPGGGYLFGKIFVVGDEKSIIESRGHSVMEVLNENIEIQVD